MKAKDYADIVTITKTSTNKFRYSVRYKGGEVFRAAKAYLTHAAAYRASVKSMKAKKDGSINFIE